MWNVEWQEHVGFGFEPDLEAAADAIQLHSQGFNSAALRQAALQLEATAAAAAAHATPSRAADATTTSTRAAGDTR